MMVQLNHPRRSNGLVVAYQILQRIYLSVSLIFFFICTAADAKTPHSGQIDCGSGLRTFDPLIHKETYWIGVHAPGGIDTAWREFNLTFEDYLSATAGQRFQPPIQFKMSTTDAPIYDWVDRKAETNIDFIYSDTGVFSCIGTEIGAQPIATTRSHMEARGHEHDLTMFAGVIFALAENDKINSIKDLEDATIGALAISDFAGGQAQFYAMVEAGMDFIMDPKQVIFTDNQYDIVRGVLNGDWEVGFVRTGQIERTADDNGDLIDPTLFKTIDPKIYVLDDGALFPFLHSTPIFPEWPVAAMRHVASDVAEEVQNALFKLGEYKHVQEMIHICKNDICAIGGGCPDNIIIGDDFVCDTAPIEFFAPEAPCETTRELAQLAYSAGIAGNHDGFRTARSYFDVRTMQEKAFCALAITAGFIKPDKKGKPQCIRAETLYDGVFCPPHHYKLSRERFESACDDIGLPCDGKYDCYCKPCVKAFEVDVYEYSHGRGDIHFLANDEKGCAKMSLCGDGEQTRPFTFRLRDNKERADAAVMAVIHMDERSREIPVRKMANETFMYEFSFSEKTVGVGILEVFFDGVQIPESPFRVQFRDRDCSLDYPGQGRSAMSDGSCDCGSGTIKVGHECMPAENLAIILSCVMLVIAGWLGYLYLRYKRRKSDELWHVSLEELHFSEPVEIIGQGSFGVVLLAEYRGTKCAIKRALPPDGKARASKSSSKEMVGAGGGSGSADKLGSVDQQDLLSCQFDGNVMDIEAQTGPVGKRQSAVRGSRVSSSFGSSSLSQDSTSSQLSFLGVDDFVISRGFWARWCPSWMLVSNEHARIKSTILAAHSESKSGLSIKGLLCPWFDRQSRQKEAFLEEMRLLSRLRHPCITTVMGAVMSSHSTPMLVMEYMEYGSLYDLIHSETMFFSGEINLQIARDITQGLRYLHSSKPPICHGDLKAKNILVDSRFRAKVCDFGLSVKKKGGISGTPFWLAPEYLRGKTDYNTTCDMYSVGIILWELYSRQQPYKGENYRKALRSICDPRKNHRPKIPDTTPPKMATLMKSLWSPDPTFRPQAKDLDMALMDMSVRDAENLTEKDDKGGKTKDMLYEIFPKHVADALKQGQKVEPEEHSLVTVVFAEIVRFQEISKKLSPIKVTSMANRAFFALDKLAKEHEIFKVETVGECYLGVTNLGGKQENTHVKNVALFALASIEALAKILVDEENPKLGHVHIRIGFHSGPIVTNVIGSLNPRYGLFGDTVNTASRMESNSIPNRIQCTEKAAILLRDQDPNIIITRRGKIAVKGKGEMVTYWVGGRDLLGKASGHSHQSASHGEMAEETQHVSFAGEGGGGGAGAGEEGQKGGGKGGGGGDAGGVISSMSSAGTTSTSGSLMSGLGSILKKKKSPSSLDNKNVEKQPTTAASSVSYPGSGGPDKVDTEVARVA